MNLYGYIYILLLLGGSEARDTITSTQHTLRQTH